jgi:hypothetical protein
MQLERGTIQHINYPGPQVRHHYVVPDRDRSSRIPRHKSMRTLEINLDKAVFISGSVLASDFEHWRIFMGNPFMNL